MPVEQASVDARHRHVGLDARPPTSSPTASTRPAGRADASSTRCPSRSRSASSPTPTAPHTVAAARPTDRAAGRDDLAGARRPTAAPPPATRSQTALSALGQRKGKQSPPAAIVLLSDGEATTGRDPAEVARQAERLRRPDLHRRARHAGRRRPRRPVRRSRSPSRPTPRRCADRAASGGRLPGRRRRPARRRLPDARLADRHQGEKREITAGFAGVGLLLLAAPRRSGPAGARASARALRRYAASVQGRSPLRRLVSRLPRLLGPRAQEGERHADRRDHEPGATRNARW